jgi:hypothetical protein
MRERVEPILKIACLILAALLLYEFAGIFLRINPLRGVVVPALPALAASTNNPAGGARGTNLIVTTAVTIKGTNSPISAGTNFASSTIVVGSNSIAPPVAITKETNFIAHDTPAKTETNVVSRLQMKMNETNSASATTNAQNGTNILIATTAATNVSHRPKPGMPGANFIPPGMAGGNFNPFAPRGKPADDLPPVVQARISRIVDSEILGQVMHPLPMALLGIAGDVAFLRSDSGETGLVKEGDSLGELKLLKIGINRVLVEQNGQKSELMIFSGYGGESLLPKQNDETNHP